MSDDPIGGITDTQTAQAEAFARLVKRVEQLETLEQAPPPDYILIRDEKGAGVAGGAFTTGAWRTRDLNTEVSDIGGHATLAGNQITLMAGTYEFIASAPAHRVDRHQARLYNVTDNIEFLGEGSYSGSGGAYGQTRSFVNNRFTITSSKVFELQHRCETTRAANGFGVDITWGNGIFSEIALWKVA